MALTKVKNVIDITADTVSDLLSMQHKKGSVQLLGFHERGDGGGGVFYWDATGDKAGHNGGTVIDPAITFPTDWTNQTQLTIWFTAGTGTGVWRRQREGAVNVKWFGAVGDYTTNDTDAIDNLLAYTAPLGLTAYFGDGVYRYTGTLVLPDGFKMKGNSAPRIAAYPQVGGDKSKLRPTHKHLISGACIIFDGTGTTSTYSTNRSDKFASVIPMAKYTFDSPYELSNMAFIQDMDVYTEAGVLTTSANDNIASAYTAGFVTQASISLENNFVLFGYFSTNAYILHNENGGFQDPDYTDHVSCLITSGVAILGHDTAAGAATEGLTGSKWTNCGLYGADHHNRVDGIYTVQTLFIDGYLNAGDNGIRGHHFVNTNFRTYANTAMLLDHVDDMSMTSCTYEFATLVGVTNADAAGTIVGTANTNDVRIIAPASTGSLGLDALASIMQGSLLVFGGDNDQDVLISDSGKGIALRGSGDDSVIQLTNDFSSIVNGWTILRDSSDADEFELRYDNVSRLRILVDGSLASPFGMKEASAQTISGGVITKGSSGYFSIYTEGGATTDDLGTINGGSFAGEIIIIRATTASNTVVVKDGTGNIRCAGDFSLNNSQDRMTLQYDGANWVELSRSDNTA